MKRTTARRAVATAIVAVALTVAVAQPASAATLVLAQQSFSFSTSPAGEWSYGGSHEPCLTAGVVTAPGSLPTCLAGEPEGAGFLRMTDGGSQSSYLILNTPVSTGVGLEITFDVLQYWGGNDPGDGLAFMLIDGSVSPTQAGSSGAGIGYASYGIVPGIEGGYLGIAFDSYGAFSNPGTGTGGVAQGPNSISVRGSEASGYNYITGKTASGTLADGWNLDREVARNHVSVQISSQNILTLAVDYGWGFVTEFAAIDLATVNGPGSLPPTLKVGFSASTGGSWSIQEIQNFRMTTLAPDLGITASGGSIDPTTLTGPVTLTVADDPAGGSTTGAVTVTSTLPAGATPLSVSGAGWSCSVVGQTVTCSRSGTGADRLDAGESYPDITLSVRLASAAVLPLSVSATVTALDDATAGNDDVTLALALGAASTPAALPDANGVGGPVVLACAVLLLAGGAALLTSARRARRV